MANSNLPEKLHAELGASNAHRWMPCPGSIRLTRGLPNTDNDYSREGSAAHTLGAKSLEKDVDPSLWLGMEFVEGNPPKPVTVDEEMVEHVRTYIEHVRSRRALHPSVKSWVERKFDLSALNPPGRMFGTADHVAYDPTTYTLYVDDLKYGKGVVVEVTGNAQTRYYALGAVLSIQKEFPGLRIDEVVMTIVQPRAAHVDGPIRSETIGLVELLEFMGELLEAAAETVKPNAVLVAGDHCKFCPASGRCPAQLQAAQEVARIEFATMLPNVPEHLPPAPELLPAGDLGEMLQKIPLLEDWIKAMWAEAERRLGSGEPVKGIKLVAKRAYRKWVSEEEARGALAALGLEDGEMEDRKLKSPPQIEQLLGRKNYKVLEESGVVHKVSSGSTVALASDNRPEVLALPGSEFNTSSSSEGTTPNEPIKLSNEI